MTSSIPTKFAGALLALLVAGCGGSDDIRIKIDAARATYVDDLVIDYCAPSRACEFGSDAFAGTMDLTATVQVHVPTSHSPVPLAFIYNQNDPLTRACTTADINLSPDVVEFSVTVGSPSVVLSCPDPICSNVQTPPDCTAL